MDKKFTLTRGPHFLSLFVFIFYFLLLLLLRRADKEKRDASTKLVSLDAGKGHLQRLSLHFD